MLQHVAFRVWRFNILAIFHLVVFPFLPDTLNMLFQGAQDGIFGRIVVIAGRGNNCQSDEDG